jgi:hypothetical protein
MMATTIESRATVTVDQAAQELAGVGDAIGVAQQAALDDLGQLAAAKAVSLTQEIARSKRRYGPDSPQAQAAMARAARHAVFIDAIASQQARAAVPVPDIDPKAAIVYGRVLDSQGPVAGLAVEVLDTTPAPAVQGTGKSDAQGLYQVSVPLAAPAAFTFRVRRADAAILAVAAPVTLAEAGPFTLTPGTRAYKEFILPARSDPGPAPPAPPPPAGGPRVMPDLVGKTEHQAATALDALGPGEIAVRRQPGGQAAGTVLAQTPKAGTPLEAGATVTLTISAGVAVAIPELVGMTGPDAIVALNRAGLLLGAITGDEGRGRVTAQSPAPGQRVPVGTSVALTFGAG